MPEDTPQISVVPRGRLWLRVAGWTVLGVLGTVAALMMALRFWVLPDLDRWRPRLEAELAQRLGVSARIESLSGHLEGFDLALGLDRLELDGGRLLAARGVAATIDWRSLLRGRLRFGTLLVEHADIGIERLSRERWRVGGYTFGPGDADEATRSRRWDLPAWLTAQGDLLLADLAITYTDRRIGERVRLDGVRVDAQGRERTRQLTVRIPAVQGLSGPAAVRASLRRRGSPEVMTDASWDGQIFAEAGAIDARRLLRLVGFPVQAGDGHGDLRAWADILDNRFTGGRLSLDGRGLELRANDAEVVLPTARLDLDVKPLPNGGARLSAREAWATDRSGTRVETGSGPQTLTFDRDGRPVLGQFSLKRFDAARLLAFARELPFPADMRELLEPLTARGQVDALNLWFDASAPRSRYEMQAAFTALTAAYRDPEAPPPAADRWNPRLPSVENVTGTVSVTEREGALDISGDDVRVDFPGVFAQPEIALTMLDAQVAWTVRASLGDADDGERRRERPIVDVDLQRIEFANAHGSGRAWGRYRTKPDSLGEIDLQAEMNDVDVSQAHRYLPLTMIPKVRAWFRDALRAGRADTATLRLQGDLREFPFRPPSRGDFDLRFDVRDGRLQYGPGWPQLRDFAGEVRIARGGMSARADRARLFRMPVRSASARIRDFREPVLELQGEFSGPGQDLVRFLNESPLQRMLDGLATRARLDGDVRTTMRLDLPLRDFTAFTLAGTSRLDGATVQLSPQLPRFDRVSGDVRFSEIGLAFDQLRGTLYGGPVTIQATSPRRGEFVMRLQGTASAGGLREAFDSPLTRRLGGRTGYRADLDLRDGRLELAVRSNLAGLSSTLPPPLDKTVGQPAMLDLRLTPRVTRGGRVVGDRLRIRLRDETEAVFERDALRDGTRRVRRGAIAHGMEPILPAAGLGVQARMAVLDADAWAAFIVDEVVPFAREAGPGGGFFEGFDLQPDTIGVTAADLRFFGKDFSNVVAGGSRDGRTWRVNLQARELDGYLTWTPDEGAGRIVGRFARLHVPPDAVGVIKDAIEDQSTRSLPALDVAAESFELSGMPLGRLRMRAGVGTTGAPWRIERLSLETAAARLAASGRWLKPAGGPASTEIDFDIDLTDAGSFLAVLGFPDTLSGGAGKVFGRLGWAGSPLRLHKPSLRGTVSASMQSGRFLKAEPGIAKLIGVLSLQSIPRRLNLDFSDVFARGFAFDAIVGEASVADGVARSDSLLMQGVQAQVLIRGEADIARETQNLTVDVLPNINAGIASIAYAAVANPAVGIGTLIAQLLLEQPLRRLFSYEFAITGPWSDPEVVQTNRPDFEDTRSEDVNVGG